MWQSFSDPTPPRASEIDVWRVFLYRDSNSIRMLYDLLSDEEKYRANKYVFATDRERFIACRGTLRKIIGIYLGLGPKEIRLSYHQFGKPFLNNENLRFRFNVSHSHGVGLIAIALDREVGVDIEFVDQSFDVLSVARSAFSEDETAHLKILPRSLQATAFFSGWTRKEAYLKAIGAGLSSSWAYQSAVSLIIGENEVSFKTCFGNEIKNWSLTSLMIDEDYRAALAVEGSIGMVRYWQLSENR